ncbi:sodium transporter HKT1-like isoform X2 [Prosopis cineraria]|uniref:sodium transporter HKT1-like isoform X2 n=2 Tax=Prosopis cineraria TaxID=364024 RepID=UPI00240F4566|nr:sodium transporter HKT1-like isoform X2 [Prosopis cineraria]
MKEMMISNIKLQRFWFSLCQYVSFLAKTFFFLVTCLYRHILLRVHPLWIQIGYFMSLSFLGFCLLKLIEPRNYNHSSSRTNISGLDLLFTSVSASTVSSMSTVEMEVFSNPQLIVMIMLMLLGGELFTSMIGLFFIRLKLKTHQDKVATSSVSIPTVTSILDPFELEMVEAAATSDHNNNNPHNMKEQPESDESSSVAGHGGYLGYNSIKYLGFVVLGYQVVVQVVGITMVSVYLSTVSSAKQVLKNKGLELFTFSVFTVVSTFASCGFVPTNENMIVFAKNSGLLMMLIPQVLLGNTLYPCCLRFSIWVLGKFVKKEESEYLGKNSHEFIVFCSLDWSSVALEGLSGYEKVIGIMFQSVNSRHTGETIVDLSVISPAILVLFVVMMYLPPYTSFLPVKKEGKDGEGNSDQRRRKRRGILVENMIMSQLSYLVIFIFIICITESKGLTQDPLNFNVLNIVIEVISAYGNVGFSTGYSCKRRIKLDEYCKDRSTGFAGRWSPEGKSILMLVMLFGRLKKFNMDGGQAWILL